MSTAANPASTSDQPSHERERIDQAIGRMDDVLRQQEDVVHRQQQAYGGVKFGSGFFGWLTATGIVVLLGALAGAVALAVGGSQHITVRDAMNSQPIASATVATALGIILVGYLCGGYVAGRMARFHGGRQGVGVWLWAVAITLAAVAAGLLVGNRYDLQDRLKNMPRPHLVPGTQLSTGVALVAAMLVLSLIGAVLGGLAGMRFHRRVDRAEVERLAPERAELERAERDASGPDQIGPDQKGKQPQASR